jgi:dihydrofolate reductase
VIGGAEIYGLFLSMADRIELTEVALEPQGDTMLESFDKNAWKETAREEYAADGGQPAFAFVTLQRK